MVASAKGARRDAERGAGTALRPGDGFIGGDAEGEGVAGDSETRRFSLSGARRFRPGAGAIACPFSLSLRAMLWYEKPGWSKGRIYPTTVEELSTTAAFKEATY